MKTVLQIPKQWIAAAEELDFELEVVGRKVSMTGDTEVLSADEKGVLLVKCLIRNAQDLRLSSGAVKALERKVAEILAQAAEHAAAQKHREVTETDVTSAGA